MTRFGTIDLETARLVGFSDRVTRREIDWEFEASCFESARGIGVAVVGHSRYWIAECPARAAERESILISLTLFAVVSSKISLDVRVGDL